jgi:transcriptional regulator GlxA family with amidase domain
MDHRVKKAIDFMTANLKAPLPLSKIARKVRLSVPHLSHLFRTETGHSPGQYLMVLRMQEAAKLLSNPNLSVKEVMTRVGFGDKSNFVRSFKKAYGMTPSGYRQNIAKHPPRKGS